MKDLDEKPARLKLTEASDKRLLFVNSDNNKPKRIVYEREGKSGLTVGVDTERDGKSVKFSLKFNKDESK